MVFGRKGLGGPQGMEVRRMLTDEGSGVSIDAAWLLNQVGGLTQSPLTNEKMFTALFT